MPKKVFAVTNIKTGPEQFVAAGSEVDPKALNLTKEMAQALLDEGAIEIRVVEDEPAPVEPVESEKAPEGDSEIEETPEGDSPKE
mgnify:CR=1 FL=1